MLTAQERLDSELERRSLDLLPPDTIAQVRSLCKRPARGADILYERVMNGCVALDEQETEYRWQLWELLTNAWWICRLVIEEERREAAEDYIRRLHSDPELQASQRRLRALNNRSLKAHLVHQQRTSGQQVPLPERKPIDMSKRPLRVTGRKQD